MKEASGMKRASCKPDEYICEGEIAGRGAAASVVVRSCGKGFLKEDDPYKSKRDGIAG